MELTKDEVAVYIFAARYAMPRKTYALGLVVDCMAKHIKEFADSDLMLLIVDSTQMLEINEVKKFLDSCDVDTHMRLQAMCKKELDRRGKSDLYRS